MKATKHFEQVIKSYLLHRAATDELFAENLTKPNKNIEDCVTYILNEVKSSGCNGFADEEIFGMAVHYYDEDDIKIGEPIKDGQVVINQHVVLTEDEIQEARNNAIKRVEDEMYTKMKAKKQTKPTENRTAQPQQTSLF